MHTWAITLDEFLCWEPTVTSFVVTCCTVSQTKLSEKFCFKCEQSMLYFSSKFTCSMCIRVQSLLCIYFVHVIAQQTSEQLFLFK